MSTEGVDGDVIEILNTFEYVEKDPEWQIAISVVLIFFEVFFACQKSGVEVGLAHLEHVFSLGSLCIRQKD